MKLTADAFKQLRFTGVLLLVAIVTAGGWVYWSSIEQQRRYLTSRDFRLLTMLANQTENLIEGNARVFQGALADAPFTRASLEKWRAAAQSTVPMLQDAELVGVPEKADRIERTERRFTIVPDAPRSRLWLELRAADRPDPVLTVRMSLAALLEKTFKSKQRQSVFDTLVLATSDGRVAFVTGRRRQELQSMPLDAVIVPKALEGGKTFQQLARTISVQDGVIAGVNYKVFIQPCCESVASASKDKPLLPTGGIIVAGLIESDALHGAALAISPGLVIIGVILTLMALVVWPFLKLTFLGERQRVTLWDLVQLGACSIFGLALGAIVVITADVWVRLDADVDEQLGRLAQDLGRHLRQEVDFAYGQLVELEQGFSACSGDRAMPRVVSAADIRCPGNSRLSQSPAQGSYSDYETFALIDDKGQQRVKSAPLSWVPNRIRVRGRPYFKEVNAGRSWRFCARPGATVRQEACFLESLWSWASGQQQAVLSKPTGSKDRPVAALAFGMRSLIDPVLPPGFEYAIVDDEGAVLFHSDSQRNVHENLFTETDGDQRLRALMAGHSSGGFSTMYWGRRYRAYVEPAWMPGWSIVTLSDTQRTRGLVLEWTAVSLMLLGVYVACWVLVMLAALKMGASWLWPDSRRRSRYLILAGAYIVLLAIFAGVALSGDSGQLLVTGLAIAAAAWTLAFVILRSRSSAGAHKDERGSRNAASEYALAGALFLVLSGVVPGAAFVVRSYDLHIESYIKYRQLSLARAFAARDNSEAAYTQDTGIGSLNPKLAELGRYTSFFYDTNVDPGRPVTDSNGAGQRPVAHHDLLLSMLETYLPYYSESSVEMRELLHDHADDGTWASRRVDGNLELSVSRNGFPGTQLVVTSVLPRPVPFSGATHASGTHPSDLVIVPYIAPVLLICLGGVAYAIVVFLLRHVYLSGVYEPLWASGRLAATAAGNLLVLCDDSSAMAGNIQKVSTLTLGAIRRSADPAATWTKTLMKISSAEPGRAVVITDLDSDLEDVDLTHAKLELLGELVNDPARTVVVLSQSHPTRLLDSVRPGQHGPDRALWQQLLRTFVVVDWRDDNVRQTSGRVCEVLDGEGRIDRFVRRICDDIRESQAFQSGFLSREQILDEIEERASGYYQRLWDTCSDEEKVVLGHVAQDGLTNAATRRLVRRLLVRRLLTKDPDLRLMNRTFRNFILSPSTMRQVAQLEGVAEPSTWDRLRMPFALAAAAAGVFLFSTQRDMFNETVTVVAAVGAAVPTVLRAVTAIVRPVTGAASPGGNA